MELKELTPQEYKNLFPNPYHIFNNIDFNLMNAVAKGVVIKCIAFKTSKFRLGLIGGVVNNKFISPFSAPFGGFSYIKEDVNLQTIEEAIDLLHHHCRSNNITEIHLTLPPFFFNMGFISKLNNVLYRKGFGIAKSDLNYSIPLKGSFQDYLRRLDVNGRRNLNIALSKNFTFFQCQTPEEKEQAYNIIKKNRESKGYPLRMTFEAIKNTIDIVKVDFFMACLDNEAVAAAIIFHVAKSIVQVIYWGDLPEYGMNKTMNYLSSNVVRHYYENTTVKIIDVGPSTDNSIPNYGLCEFKESIGCKVFPKLSWEYKIES